MSRRADRKTKERSATRSLTFYLTLLIVLQMTSLFVFVGFVSVSDFRHARTAATERATEDSQRAANLISGAVSAAERSAVTEAALPGYAAVFDDPSRCTVTSSGSEVFTKGQFHVLRGDASVACSSTQSAGGIPGAGYGGQPWLAQLDTAEQAIVAGPLNDPITGQTVLIVAAPILEVPGTVVISLELKSLGAGLDTELGDRIPAAAFHITAADGSTEIASSASFDNSAELIRARADVPELAWKVVAGIDTAEVYAPAWTAVRERVFFAMIVLTLVCAFGLVINRRVARPIKMLLGAVEEAALGEGVVRVPETGPKEIRKLGKRFNRMIRERDEAEVGLVDMFDGDRGPGGREVDRMKSAFLMAVSHELRTPLAVITGYADILQDQIGELSEDEASSIAHDIALGASRLERLLLDILDLERMSRGMFEAQRKSTHLRGLVNRVLDFSDYQGDVKVDVPNNLVADVDAGLTERILDNLVRNAIKHTPAGTPMWIGATCKNGELELTVADAGPGIPDAIKAEVFEAFAQGDTPSHSPGTGVGLSLVAQFARLHHGRAWVDDRPGGGARFHVTFANAVPADVVKSPRAKKRTTLKKSA